MAGILFAVKTSFVLLSVVSFVFSEASKSSKTRSKFLLFNVYVFLFTLFIVYDFCFCLFLLLMFLKARYRNF